MTGIRRVARNLALAMISVAIPILLAAPAHASSIPVGDPKVAGVVGLCSPSLRPISNGSVTTTPFVWRAVGATAARGQYAEAGRTATLYAYQPRPGIPAGEWSGTQLTSSGHYSNPAHPMAQATAADTSLADFVADFPPEVDGLIELRLYLGGPQLPLNQTSYDATFIRVTDKSWSVVAGGSVDCNSGNVVSLEQLVLPSSAQKPPPASVPTDPTTRTSTSPAKRSGSTGAADGAVSAASVSSAAPSAPAAGSTIPVADQHSQATSVDKTSSSTWLWIVVGVVGAALLAGGAYLARRRWR